MEKIPEANKLLMTFMTFSYGELLGTVFVVAQSAGRRFP